MCFGIGQNILQASLTHLQLVPGVFGWNPSPYHSSMAARPLVHLRKWLQTWRHADGCWLTGYCAIGMLLLIHAPNEKFNHFFVPVPPEPLECSSKFTGVACTGAPAPNFFSYNVDLSLALIATKLILKISLKNKR